MTRIRYRDLRLRDDALQTIGRIAALIEEYRAQGLSLTVRQIHYQFVSRGWLPNTARTYTHIQQCTNKGRLAGLLDWEAIEDRGRNLRGLRHHTSPASTLRKAAEEYRLDLWAGQPFRPEVWVEKQALEGVIEEICCELRVDFYACKGYNSQSEQWRAGQRFAGRVRDGQRPIVFHLGDHDPSGLDMTSDNRDRLTEFAGVPILVQRLALNMPQVEELRPPPNFAKQTDSRFAEYQALHGDESWELDALDPRYIRDLIRDAVDRVRDESLWSEALAQEVEDIRHLHDIADSMEDPSE